MPDFVLYSQLRVLSPIPVHIPIQRFSNHKMGVILNIFIY